MSSHVTCHAVSIQHSPKGTLMENLHQSESGSLNLWTDFDHFSILTIFLFWHFLTYVWMVSGWPHGHMMQVDSGVPSIFPEDHNLNKGTEAKAVYETSTFHVFSCHQAVLPLCTSTWKTWNMQRCPDSLGRSLPPSRTHLRHAATWCEATFEDPRCVSNLETLAGV